MLTLELLAERKIAVTAAFLLAVAGAFFSASADAAGIDVFYIGTDDCFYCQHWEAARKPELLAAMQRTTARLIEIRGDSISKPVTERHYPPQHRWLFRQLGELRGVPRFVLVVDGKIVARALGTSDYSKNFAPRVRAALAAGAAAR